MMAPVAVGFLVSISLIVGFLAGAVVKSLYPDDGGLDL